MSLRIKDQHLKNAIIYILLLFPLTLSGQMSSLDDTIRINEVIISSGKIPLFPPGYKRTYIDSTVISNYNSGSLSELLSEQSSVFVKSYGMSGVASLSFRGTGASQTLIDWNGINLNSPMLGQTDLSLIPVGLVDNIQVYYGGASMTLNTGGIGGAINLETKPVWKKETIITLNSGTGSFSDYSGLVKVKAGNTHFQSVTKGYFQSSENNFRYLDNESGLLPVWMTRTNSQASQRGFIQELYFNNPYNVISARLWYQTSDRHLPPTIQSEDFTERQFDESLRIMLNDNISARNSNYLFTGAFLMGNLNYTNQKALIDSRNHSETFVMKAERESYHGDYTKLKLAVNDELNYVKSNNYGRNVYRNNATFTATLERECANRFGLTLLLREILLDNKFLIPDFSTGIQFKLSDKGDNFLKAGISRNSRIPTMNELFYSVYGNPDLKNEYAFIYEVSWEISKDIFPGLNIRSDLSLFHNAIKDMIQWQPVAGTLIVDNIRKVNSTGLESSVSFLYASGKFSAKINAGYSLTKATTAKSYYSEDGTLGKQLMYMPLNQANSMIRFSFGYFYSSLGTSFTGTRFTTTDHLGSLPYYTLNNTITGIKLPLKKNSVDISLNINNLFAVNYQSIAGYPMPGRTYLLKVIMQIVK